MITKLSKSESGKLGALASRQIVEDNKRRRIEEYNNLPKKCELCDNTIPYEKRYNRFCSKSCGALFTNKSKEVNKTTVVWTCRHCEAETGRTTRRKQLAGKIYCSAKCQKEYEFDQRIKDWKLTGILVKSGTPPWLKRYILEKQGGKCAECGIDSWNNKPIVFDLEHKDGNSGNNVEDNLCCLCPNCHSQTPTYKAKNKGNGRHNRKQRYKDGKSF